ncbi:MAG TPA: hypothetical protein VFX16_08105 [Pseudonocardiaceae bacterium]|nr:hypothetical protein [Pseudonocardiaceae bacterium]
MGLVGLIMYSQLTSLPVFDGAHHYVPGLLVTALGIGLLVSMTLGGRISDSTGPRPLVRAGSGVTAAVAICVLSSALPGRPR